MIEFTISRVVLGICGVAMLAAVLSPAATIYEAGENTEFQEQCDKIADMIDSFSESKSDSMTVFADQIIPNDAALKLDGHTVSIIRGDEKFNSLTSRLMIGDEKSFGCNDVIKLTKRDGNVMVSKINP